jgi:hypothetical protein
MIEVADGGDLNVRMRLRWPLALAELGVDPVPQIGGWGIVRGAFTSMSEVPYGG